MGGQIEAEAGWNQKQIEGSEGGKSQGNGISYLLEPQSEITYP